MEEWEFDFEWLRIQHLVKDAIQHDKLPNLQSILFLIGIQELGFVQKEFTKEEKQDLMHIAVCTLLSSDGYYAFKGLDQDGWPHFDQLRSIPEDGAQQQEQLLKTKVIHYFRKMEAKSEASDAQES